MYTCYLGLRDNIKNDRLLDHACCWLERRGGALFSKACHQPCCACDLQRWTCKVRTAVTVMQVQTLSCGQSKHDTNVAQPNLSCKTGQHVSEEQQRRGDGQPGLCLSSPCTRTTTSLLHWPLPLPTPAAKRRRHSGPSDKGWRDPVHAFMQPISTGRLIVYLQR